MKTIIIRAKVKESGDFIEYKININDKIYKSDNDSLYDFIYDFLNQTYGDIFKWFRFWTLIKH